MAHMRASITELLAPDLRKVYVEKGTEYPREYPMVLNVSDMEWNPITDQQVSGLGTMPGKPEGTQFNLDQVIMGGTKTYTAQPYGLAVEITYEAWKDELYGVFKEMVSCLAEAGRNREEVSAFAVLNNAFSTTYDGFTSGESLCSTSHTSLDTSQTAQGNRPSVDIGFSLTGIQAGMKHFQDLKNDRGLPTRIKPTRLLITSNDMYAAREILGSQYKPYTSDNEINALVEDDLSYMVGHYITTDTYWFLLAAPGKHDLNFFWRDRPQSDMFDNPWTKDAVFTAYQRHTIGAYASWKGVYGSTG